MRTTERGRHAGPENAGGARQKTMTLLIPVLAVTLVLIARKPARTPQSAPASPIDSAATIASETNDIQIDWQRPPLYRSGGSDPMRLAAPIYMVEDEDDGAPQRDVSKSLALRGVLYSEDKPAAIVGTRLVHEGEQVSGVTVVRIEKNGVVFEMNGERWKQTVSAPSRPPNPDKEENRTRPTGSQGNDDDVS